MNRDAFLAERKTGIGGSDIHHLLNVAPYGCRRWLWYDKTDATPDYPRDETAAMRRGNVLESVAAQEFTYETGIELMERPLLRHPVEEWAIVHIDRILAESTGESELAQQTRYTRFIAEIKCPGREMFLHIKRSGMPPAYILQAQHGMFVSRTKACIFIVFCTDPWELLWFPVDRNEDLIAKIVAQGKDFWSNLAVAPDQLPASSPQCKGCNYRHTCQGDALLPEESRKEAVPFDVDLREVVERYQEMKAIEDEAGELVAAARADLEKALGSRTAVDTVGFRIYFRPSKPRQTMNEERVGAVLERLLVKVDYDGNLVKPVAVPIAECKKIGEPARPLKVYPR